MTSPQDEAEDSRTSGVGRKRDLQELMVQDDTGVSSKEDSQQRSHKRAKQDLESLGHLAIEDVVALDASSSAAVEPSSPSQNVPRPASQATQPTSWNTSVQGGLRTSFGSKAQGNMNAAAPDFADLVDEVESPRPTDFGNGAADFGDVNMDLQQDHLAMAETSDPSSEGIGGDIPSAPSPEHEESQEVSYPASDSEVGDDSGSDMDNQFGTEQSDGALDEMLAEDEDESLSAINHGSAVNDDGLSREPENVTKGGAKHAYPTNVRPDKRVYKSDSQTYHLSELRKEGQQISLKDFNFKDFVRHFITTNPENYQLLKAKNFKGAYNSYLSAYYYKGSKTNLMGKLDAASEQLVKAAIQDMKTLPTITPPTILDPEYPRDISKFKDTARYYKGQYNNEFELIEVLKDEKQISLHDITLQDFAPHFMRTNPRNFHLLSPRMVVAAFKSYLNLYYGNQSAETRERILGAASQGRDKFIEKTLQDTQRILLTSEYDENANQPSTVPLTTEMASANREMAGVAPRSPKPIEVGYSRVPNAQQVAPLQSSNAAAISFTPINAPRPSIPTQLDATSSNTQKISSASQLGHDVSNDGVVVTKADSLPDLSESRASSEESDADMDVDIDKVEMDLQLKYFPAVDGKVIGPRCLACADIGHKTLDCPALLCSFCGDGGNHSDYTCPQNQRCGKCRQKGHSKEDCPEKLLARNAETGECDLCKSSEHLEVNCHYIWRSFVPKSEEVRTVSGIPIHCYSCGSTGHYGPECGLHQGIVLSGGITWSKSNLQKYLDRNSKDRAICSGVDYSIPKNPGKVFNIKGKANDPITLDDSDDEVSFLHSRVDKAVAKPHQGQIRFGQNQQPAVNLSGNTSNNRNPQRHAALDFGPHHRQQDSARYGRERSFSPPPAYDNYDQAFPQDDHYRSQAPVLPYRQNNYRPPAGSMQGPSQTYTFQPARNQPGGGNRGRIGNSRGGGGRGGGAAHAPPNEPKQKKKKTKQKAAKAVRGGKAPR